MKNKYEKRKKNNNDDGKSEEKCVRPRCEAKCSLQKKKEKNHRIRRHFLCESNRFLISCLLSELIVL